MVITKVLLQSGYYKVVITKWLLQSGFLQLHLCYCWKMHNPFGKKKANQGTFRDEMNLKVTLPEENLSLIHI